MSDNQNQFCLSLQAMWSIIEATYSGVHVKLVLERSDGIGKPDPLGRLGHLVMAEPHVSQVRQSAEITFEGVRWFQIVDEAVYAMTEHDENSNYDGHYFRCYSQSTLLTRLIEGFGDGGSGNFKHYQLVTGDDIVDIVSAKAPTVSLRGASDK